MDLEILASAVGDTRRSAPQSAAFLLPVWGYPFVMQFLDFCLPTLLAPGNIPAVSTALPTRFIVLTREIDAELIDTHPAWRALQRLCSAEISFIDDLITEGNHTTTITLAFARAVRKTQQTMLDTCFIFLMSDYLFADGSLRTVIDHFLNGASGVVAGNFQVIAEEAAPAFRQITNPTSGAINVSSRELVAWSLGYLHPATTANMVNVGLVHNAHTNRLLWRVDENTLIGRFYLIHPIGVRPEITDFVVGSSLDYSFIPEMCPSGNVVTITDSDDYFVVEMQPRRHERANLRAGPLREPELAISLSEWTTAQHRKNAEHTIIYHAVELPPNIEDVIATADDFVIRIGALLSPKPQPFRNHPYWAGAIASNRLQTGQALSKDDWKFLLGEAIPSAGIRAAMWRFNWSLFGAPPAVTRLHTRWPDYHLPRQALRDVLATNGRLLLVCDQPLDFAHWLIGLTNDVCTIEWDRLLEVPLEEQSTTVTEWYQRLLGSFDACLFVVTEPVLVSAGEAIQRASPLLRSDAGQILIMVLNDRPYFNAAEFKRIFAEHATELIARQSWVAEIYYVSATRLRWLVYRFSDRVRNLLRDAYLKHSVLLPFYGVAFVLAGLLTGASNLWISARKFPPKGLWSSVFLMLYRSRQEECDSPHRNNTALSQKASWEGEDHHISETEADNASSKTHQPFLLNERTLLQLQAAHHVAAKLLAGRSDVAIYAGATGEDLSFVKMYDVRQVAAYTFTRAGVVSSAEVGSEPRSSLSHDILAAPLPRAYDAICSLTALSHISRDNEGKYMKNLTASLSRRQDILILGCPSEDPDDWGPTGAIRREALREKLQLRTGAQLKALAERYFDCVLTFTLAGGVFYPGSAEIADYGLVVCSSRKPEFELMVKVEDVAHEASRNRS
jgi:hypothetical protein